MLILGESWRVEKREKEAGAIMKVGRALGRLIFLGGVAASQDTTPWYVLVCINPVLRSIHNGPQIILTLIGKSVMVRS